MNKLITGLTCLAFTLGASAVSAQDWVLDASVSTVSFGSVKKDTVGESHHFADVSGGVSSDGSATVSVNLASVQTNIEIRDERIVEHVFHNMAGASVTGMIDMDAIAALEVGGIMSIYVDATLNLMGNEVGFDAPMVAARLSETRVMIVSDGMSYISTADMGIDGGVDMLMELASLPGITRTVPVTVRLVFDLEE